jgi:hypothetical protein
VVWSVVHVFRADVFGHQLTVEPTGVAVELIVQSATPKGCMGGTII